MAPPPAPLEPTPSASPPPPAPGRETFPSCLRPEEGRRAPGPGRGAACPRSPLVPSGRRSAPAPRGRGPPARCWSGGSRRGFEVPAASAPALRGGGAWRQPRMPRAVLRRLAPPGRRGWRAPRQGARAHAPESPPPGGREGPPHPQRCLGFVRHLWSEGTGAWCGLGAASPPPHPRGLSGLQFVH